MIGILQMCQHFLIASQIFALTSFSTTLLFFFFFEFCRNYCVLYNLSQTWCYDLNNHCNLDTCVQQIWVLINFLFSKLCFSFGLKYVICLDDGTSLFTPCSFSIFFFFSVVSLMSCISQSKSLAQHAEMIIWLALCALK